MVLTFKGHLGKDDVIDPILRFHELAPKGDFTVLVELEDMDSYDPEVRVRWMDALRPYREHIKALVLQGVTNPLIRMAGRAVGWALKIPVVFT